MLLRRVRADTSSMEIEPTKQPPSRLPQRPPKRAVRQRRVDQDANYRAEHDPDAYREVQPTA